MTDPRTADLRVVFFGTPRFALPSLRALAAGTSVAAVVAQPDRPAGRGRKMASPPVADAARAMGLRLMQPESLRAAHVVDDLQALRPDLLVAAAYGRIIPRAVLDLPRLAGINVHPSLLPAYRGASPIQAAVAEGEATTGVTIVHLADDLDAGDIILQREIAIDPEETAGDLERRLAEAGADLLIEAVRLIARGDAPRLPQDHHRATYTGKVSKRDGAVQWDRPAQAIVNHVRAMSPWPCAYASWRGGTLRIWRARAVIGQGIPGEVLAAGEDGIVVAAGQAAVALLEVQAEGGRRMSAAEFLRGHTIRAGERFSRQI